MKLTPKAEALISVVISPSKMTDELRDFQEEISTTEDFGYALFDGGYIDPELIVEGEDLVKLQEAIELVRQFKDVYSTIAAEY